MGGKGANAGKHTPAAVCGVDSGFIRKEFFARNTASFTTKSSLAASALKSGIRDSPPFVVSANDIAHGVLERRVVVDIDTEAQICRAPSDDGGAQMIAVADRSNKTARPYRPSIRGGRDGLRRARQGCQRGSSVGPAGTEFPPPLGDRAGNHRTLDIEQAEIRMLDGASCEGDIVRQH